jgi:hypothetical protein
MSFSLWIVSDKNRTEDIPDLYQAEDEEAIKALVLDEKLRLAGSELLELFPPLENLNDDDIDNSPWSDTPEISDYWIHLSIRFSKVDFIFEKTGHIFEKFKLVGYDPQNEKVYG